MRVHAAARERPDVQRLGLRRIVSGAGFPHREDGGRARLRGVTSAAGRARSGKTESVTPDAFFVRDGDLFQPTPATAGPWDPGLQHGGPPAALLGMALEATLPRPGTRIAHFALELLSPVPLAPMRVTTEVVRPGKKIELLGAKVEVGGRPALRATAWRLAVEEEGEGRNPEVNASEPPPRMPDAPDTRLFRDAPSFGYGLALEWRFAEGGFHVLGPATVWSRLRVAIVQGEPVGALARALAMVDSANGMSAELEPSAYLFVPVNLTVSLARAPVGEWVGMSAKTTLTREGAGTTRARLFDTRGYFGDSLQTLFVEKQPKR